ncbi:hypothetical protein BC827DRAFT_921768 [Russula dissimulans]|nr:hypothetical protein BC827DRAFT_921768 [Russula dissimulans]
MVNSNGPNVIPRDFFTAVKLWHTVYGLYIWEFFTTLDYEWSVIRRHRPYRWTIWLYSLTRVATLVSAIIVIVGFDTSRPINCQLWVTFSLIFAYTAVSTASLLIVLRVNAIWNKNRTVYAISMSAWVANVSCLINATVRLRGTWSVTDNSCTPLNTSVNKLNAIVSFCTDLLLLLIMLIGLLRWRYRIGQGITSSLTRFLWTQGLVWIFIVTIAYVPSVILLLFNLNPTLDMMLQTPTLITLSIAATRMYRSLADFGSRDIVISIPRTSGLTPRDSNRTYVAPIRFNRMEGSTTAKNSEENSAEQGDH